LVKAIFVTGLPRSGTSFLASCINWHPHVGPRHEAMDGYDGANEWVKHIYHHKYTQFIEDNQRWSVWLPSGGVFGAKTPTLHDGQVDGLAEAIIGDTPEPVYLSKSPTHLWRMGALRKSFPGARFVIILRRAESVYASILDKDSHNCPWPLLSDDGMAWFSDRWRAAMGRIRANSGADTLVIGYEMLCVLPGPTLRNVLAHCELGSRVYVNDIRPKREPWRWYKRIPNGSHRAVMKMAKPLNDMVIEVER
jgi:hypothetical protein